MFKPFRSRLCPAVCSGGFSMKDYWIWCGSPAKGQDGRFHLFASRWLKTLPFSPNWVSNSEVVRASSDRAEGPYVFENVVLPPRPGFWDATMTHNPSIHKHGDTWILFYTETQGIGPDCSDAPPTKAISEKDFARYWLSKRKPCPANESNGFQPLYALILTIYPKIGRRWRFNRL